MGTLASCGLLSQSADARAHGPIAAASSWPPNRPLSDWRPSTTGAGPRGRAGSSPATGRGSKAPAARPAPACPTLRTRALKRGSPPTGTPPAGPPAHPESSSTHRSIVPTIAGPVAPGDARTSTPQGWQSPGEVACTEGWTQCLQLRQSGRPATRRAPRPRRSCPRSPRGPPPPGTSQRHE